MTSSLRTHLHQGDEQTVQVIQEAKPQGARTVDVTRKVAQAAEDLGARVVPVAQRGYGAAIAGGIEAARGRYVIMADADDSYDFANLDAFVAALRAGAGGPVSARAWSWSMRAGRRGCARRGR